MQWTLKTFEPSVKKEWDQFVNQQPTGSIHQSAIWKDFQSQIPGREQVLGFYALDAQGHWIAATWCVKMNTGVANKHWYYSARGPVIASQEVLFKVEFLEAVSLKLRDFEGLFWRLDPFWQEADWHEIKAQKKLPVKPATKNFQPTDSLLLDLSLSEEGLKAQMHRQGRKAIRVAQEAGIETEIIPADKVSDLHLNFWQALNTDTTERDGFSGHDKKYYERFIKTLKPHTFLCFAHHQQKPIAAAILTLHNHQAIYYFGASSSEPSVRNLRAPYALQWAMIKFAKQQGAHRYDFTGITPKNQPNHSYKGITQFKTRFGGYRATYAAGKEIVLHRAWYTLYRLIKRIKT